MPTDVPVPTKSGRFIERDGALIECDADGKPLGVVHERVAPEPKAEAPKPAAGAVVPLKPPGGGSFFKR